MKSNTRNVHSRSPTSESAPKTVVGIKRRETSSTYLGKDGKSNTSSGGEKVTKIANSKKKSTTSGASGSGGG